MFSGIVQELGTINSLIRKSGGGARLTVRSTILGPDRGRGDSVAINGVCLTVVERDGDTLDFDLSDETLEVTNLGGLKEGISVNLEASLRIGDDLGGHFVSGHIDEVGSVIKREDQGDCSVFTISVSPDISRLIIHKGSISIDGISLTVARTRDREIEVVIIPHTLAVTTLGAASPGDRVNLEADMIGKYVAKLVPNSGFGD